MHELTDYMIAEDLKETVYKSNENTLMIVIMIVATIVGGVIFLFTNSKRQKIASAGIVLLFLIFGVIIIGRNNFMKNAINNGKWEVQTDIVDRVMEQTDDDGDVSYFMVLKKYGRVSLDDYSEAIQYYAGAEIYIIVVPKGDEYKDTGVTYPIDYYYYKGSH